MTATKRGTDIQRTPEAITAISGATLAATGKDSVADLASLAPSLSIGEPNANTAIFLRGVGHTNFSAGADPGVAFYSDGVNLGDTTGISTALIDLDRVEILRGPQGALYGRDAVGGAIIAVSAEPTHEPSGRVRVTFGDYGVGIVEGFLSGPLLDDAVTARLSYQVRHDDGFTRNLIADTPGAPRRLDQTDSQTFRLQFAAPIGETGRLRLIGGYQRQEDNGTSKKIVPEPTPMITELLFGQRPTDAARAVSSSFSERRRRVWNLTARYEQEIGDARLTVIADTRKNRISFGYDADGTAAPVASLRYVDRGNFASRQSSVEAYVSGERGENLEWLAGGSYLRLRQFHPTVVDVLLPLGFLQPGLPLNVGIPATFDLGGTVWTESWAAYADVGLRLTDTVKVRGGARYNHDRKHAEEYQVIGFAGINRRRSNPGESWAEWTGKVGVDFTPAEPWLVYANAGRGYKSGAINLGAFTPTVDPEIVRNVELGVKYTAPDRRLLVNAAAFHSKYTNMQVTQVGAVSAVLGNAAKATIDGAEVEATIAPSSAFQMSLSASYLDATFDRFMTRDQRLGNIAVDASGNRLPMTSKWQIGIHPQYRLDLPGGSELTFAVDYAWRSRLYFYEFRDPLRSQGGYGLLDAAVHWRSAGADWRVSAYARNLGDNAAWTSMLVGSPIVGGARTVEITPPRTFALAVEYSF